MRVASVDYLDSWSPPRLVNWSRCNRRRVATGIWYHVAGVRGSNFVQLYVNGRLENQTNITFAQDYGNTRSTSAPRAKPTGTASSRACWTRCPSTTGRFPRTKSPPFTRRGRGKCKGMTASWPNPRARRCRSGVMHCSR